MSRHIWIVVVAVFVAGIGLIGVGNSAQAAPAGAVVGDVEVLGADAAAVLAGLTPELWALDGTSDLNVWSTYCASSPGGVNNPESAYENFSCSDLPAGNYAMGLDGAPVDAYVNASCFVAAQNDVELIPSNSAEFVVGEPSENWICHVFVVVPTLRVDKIVVGGAAVPSDFTLEVFGAGGMPEVTVVDPSVDQCGPYLSNVGCAAVGLPSGDYQLGETPARGYLPTNVGCVRGGEAQERFPAGVGEFSLELQEGQWLTYCQVTNTYFEGDIVVTKVVVNDDGGTAIAADFAAEVYTAPGGSLVASGNCAADGSCIDESLPIGEYQIGESGPSGYTASVACSVTREPDVPGIGTAPPSTPPPSEKLPGVSALLKLEPYGQVTCVITNNDDPVEVTIAIPSTTESIRIPVLPATGGDSDSLGVIAALGAAMLLMGGTLLVARRRS